MNGNGLRVMKNMLLKSLDVTGSVLAVLTLSYVLGMAYIAYYQVIVFGGDFTTEFTKCLNFIFIK